MAKAKKKRKTLEDRIRGKACRDLREEIDRIFSGLYVADVFGECSHPVKLYKRNSTVKLGSTEVIEALKEALFQRDKLAVEESALDEVVMRFVDCNKIKNFD